MRTADGIFYGVMAGVALVGVAWLTLLAQPVAAAEEAPKCYTEAALVADSQAHGLTEVGAASYTADNTDEIIIVAGPSSVTAFFFKKGCVVAITPVDRVTPPTGV